MDKKTLVAALLTAALVAPSAAFARTAEGISAESEDAAKEAARAAAIAYCTSEDKEMDETHWKVDRDGDSYVAKLTYSCKKSSGL